MNYVFAVCVCVCVCKQEVRQKSSFGVCSNFHFYKYLKQNKRDSIVSGRQKREAANCLKYSNEGIRSALFIPEMFMLVTIYFSLFLSMPRSEAKFSITYM